MGQPTVAFGKEPLFSRSLFSSRSKWSTAFFLILPLPPIFSPFSPPTPPIPLLLATLRLLTRATDSNKIPVSIVASSTMPFVLHVCLEHLEHAHEILRDAHCEIRSSCICGAASVPVLVPARHMSFKRIITAARGRAIFESISRTVNGLLMVFKRQIPFSPHDVVRLGQPFGRLRMEQAGQPWRGEKHL